MDIPSSELMATAEPYHVLDGYDFLAYPNRDSTPFQQYYNIPEACTVVRGSLRYNGNPQLVRALLKIGYLDAQHNPWLKAGMTWAEITSKVLGSSGSSERSVVMISEQPNLDTC
jgi:saccharopine dehydrogenase (NADP+, L-glutamate forming)